MRAAPVQLDERLRGPVGRLLTGAGLGNGWVIAPLPGGANNRVFRVDADGTTAFLKIYFYHETDPRDRLGAEFAFSTFAWANGIRCIPRPLGRDPECRLGLYTFVHGRPFSPGDVGEPAVREALAFFEQLNRHRHLAEARALPRASEACFALPEHLEQIGRRVERLLRLPEAGADIDREASAFVRTELAPRWRRMADAVSVRASALGAQAGGEIAEGARCLSPSDFGFHNALRSADGSAHFIDFEYAGWDDPAKTVCDFFWQQAVPVPFEFYEMVRDSVASMFGTPDGHRQRIAVLLPLYGVKWCCIALNEFLPVGLARRSFTRGTGGNGSRKQRQLATARRILRAASERSG